MVLRRLARFLDRSDGSLQQKAVRSGVWVGLSTVVSAGISFLRSIILARILMPEVFGLMAICSMVIQGIEIFTETGFTAALIHRQQRFEEARDTAFTLWVVRGVGLALIAIILAPWVAAFYDQAVLSSMVTLIGVSFILIGFRNINTIALQKELNFKRLILMEQISGIWNLIIAVGLAYWLRDVWALVYAQLASAVISVSLSYALVPGRPRFRFNPVIARELFTYGKFMTGLAAVVFIANQLDNAMIGKLLSMEALGYYSLAYTLANLPSTNLSKVVARVLFPMFSKLQSDLPQLRVEYARGIRLLIAVVVPISFAIIVLADDIVLTVYGAKWAAAVVPLQILSVFGCLQALWMLNGYLFNAVGKPHIDFYTNTVRLLLVVSLLYPLTMMFGIAGTSLAITVPMAVQFAVGVYLSVKVIGVQVMETLRPLGISLLQGGALAGVLFSVKTVIPDGSMLGLIFLLAIAALVAIFFNRKEILAQLAAHNVTIFPARGTL